MNPGCEEQMHTKAQGVPGYPQTKPQIEREGGEILMMKYNDDQLKYSHLVVNMIKKLPTAKLIHSYIAHQKNSKFGLRVPPK